MTLVSEEASVVPRYARAPRLRITQTDEEWDAIIEKAIPKDSSHCVWADAIKASVPWATNISVDIQTIRITDRDRKERYVYLTPRSIQESIVDFDAGIKPPNKTVALRGGAVHRSGRKDSPAKPRSPAQKAATEKARQARLDQAKARRDAVLGRQTLVDRNEGGAPPEIVGGKMPPVQHGRFGKRREFGVRGLDR